MKHVRWNRTFAGAAALLAGSAMAADALVPIEVPAEFRFKPTGVTEAVMYTEAVEKRGYSLEKFVDVVSSNAARILGLYPRKGAIAVGSDADLTVLDTSQRRTVRAQDLPQSDYAPWEGR